jgi:hypothetical protein
VVLELEDLGIFQSLLDESDGRARLVRNTTFRCAG